MRFLAQLTVKKEHDDYAHGYHVGCGAWCAVSGPDYDFILELTFHKQSVARI